MPQVTRHFIRFLFNGNQDSPFLEAGMLFQLILSRVKMYIWAVMMTGWAQAASYRALSNHACYSIQSEMGMRG